MYDTELFKNRLNELHDRAVTRRIWIYSNFLSLSEQSEFLSMQLSDASLFGGYAAAERKIVCFGSEDSLGYSEIPPITCIRIEPVNEKFSDNLTHRDYLGSIIATGIDRGMLGDIIIRANTAWVICCDKIADYIIASVKRVRHTTVRCSMCEVPEFINEEPSVTSAVAASERLDAIVAGVYHISRSEGKQVVESGRVFLDGRLCENPSMIIRPKTIVSVRGTGRFRYEGVENETHRGRLRILIRKY